MQNNFSEEPVQTQTKWTDLLYLPVGCLMRIPAWAAFFSIILLFLAGILIYHTVNSNFMGLAATDFSEFTFSENMKQVNSQGAGWSISYETGKKTNFSGKIRHISPIRLSKFPFLTHDVLVTTGDFADPERVNTSVFNHMFTWRPRTNQQPQGTINLLHTVPMDAEIYDILWSLSNDQEVSVTGYEILQVHAFDPEGNPNGYWEDHGCNTILITEISLQE